MIRSISTNRMSVHRSHRQSHHSFSPSIVTRSERRRRGRRRRKRRLNSRWWQRGHYFFSSHQSTVLHFSIFWSLLLAFFWDYLLSLMFPHILEFEALFEIHGICSEVISDCLAFEWRRSWRACINPITFFSLQMSHRQKEMDEFCTLCRWSDAYLIRQWF